jgi:peptidoglycan/LPS O-acetylase OafA/YrhL
MNRATNTSAYIPTLDGWRAVAILAVLGYHSPAFHLGPIPVRILHNYGSQGVDLFFAISGLLICSKLLREETDKGSISLRKFYIRRVFRILPAAYVYLSVVGVLALLQVVPMPLGAWLSATFSCINYYAALHANQHLDWYVGHFWTLAVEEHFYLFLPGLLVLVPKFRRLVLSALIAFFAVWQAVFSGGWAQRTDLRIDALLIPAFLAVLLQAERVSGWFRSWLHPLIATALVIVVSVAIARIGGPLETVKPLLKVVYPLLIMSTVLHPSRWFSRCLELAPLRWIGRISYSIYLWQQLFFLDERETSNIHSPRALDALQHFPLNLIAVFLAAALSYYLIEKPLIRIGHRLAGRSVATPN